MDRKHHQREKFANVLRVQLIIVRMTTATIACVMVTVAVTEDMAAMAIQQGLWCRKFRASQLRPQPNYLLEQDVRSRARAPVSVFEVRTGRRQQLDDGSMQLAAAMGGGYNA